MAWADGAAAGRPWTYSHEGEDAQIFRFSFQRESYWLVVIYVALPLLAILLAIVIPDCGAVGFREIGLRRSGSPKIGPPDLPIFDYHVSRGSDRLCRRRTERGSRLSSDA